jgi:hypothetical protein
MSDSQDAIAPDRSTKTELLVAAWITVFLFALALMVWLEPEPVPLTPEQQAQQDELREERAIQEAREKEERQRQAEIARKRNFNETKIVTLCDITLQRLVKNPSSLSTAWTWEKIDDGRRVTFYRNFTAMNGFGAQLDNFYECIYDYMAGEFVDLKIHSGNF